MLDLTQEEIRPEGMLGRARLLIQSMRKGVETCVVVVCPKEEREMKRGQIPVSRLAEGRVAKSQETTPHLWLRPPLKVHVLARVKHSKEILEPFLWLSISPRNLTGRRKRVKPGDRNLSLGSSDNS